MTKLLRDVDNGHDHIHNLRYNRNDDLNTSFMLANAAFQELKTNPNRGDLQEMFEGRLHSLMNYTSATVEDSLY